MLIIEHFEFDCYKKSKKGSQYRIEKSKIDKKYDELIPNLKGAFFNETIDKECSLEYYLENVKTVFNQHYTKIDIYKENLLSSGLIEVNSSIKTCFLIDDVSPVGTAVFDGTRMLPVVLFQCSEFLDILRKSEKVDYLITGSNVSNQKYVWFFSQVSIDEYYANIVKYESMKFLNSKPHIIGGKFLLNKKFK